MSTSPTTAHRPVISVARTDADREACFALRYRVYEEQGRRPARADHVRRLDRNAADATGVLLQAHVDGELAATVRIHHGLGAPAWLAAKTPLGRVAAISRLAIDGRHRGGATVVSLFRGCFDYLRSDGRDTRLVIILAFDQPGLLQLYRMLGFRPLAPRLSYPTDLGRTIPMVARLRTAARH